MATSSTGCYARDAALRVLTLAHAILNLPVGEPEGETPS